jgi:hypothetical protein
MRWWTKAAALRILSLIPGGGSLYAWLQQQVTRSLVPNRGRVAQKIGVGLAHVDWLEGNHCADTLSAGTHLDFGVGWHPTIPLLHYSLGCEGQYLLAVKPALTRPLLPQTVDAFRLAKRG